MKNIKIGFASLVLLAGLFFVSNLQAATENITQIVFTTGSQTIEANATSSTTTIQTQNASSTLEQLSNTARLTIQSSSGTAELLNNSGTVAAFLTMNSGSANRNFVFRVRDAAPGTHTLTATLTVQPAGPSWSTAQDITIVGPEETEDPEEPAEEPEEEPEEEVEEEEPVASSSEPVLEEEPAATSTEPEITPESSPDSSNNGGSGGGGRSRRARQALLARPATDALLIADELPAGQVLGAQVENFLFLHDLALGSRLEPDVTELQARLAREGYYHGPKLGYYGRYTELCLRAYQAAQGLPVTGVLDAATRLFLNLQSAMPDMRF